MTKAVTERPAKPSHGPGTDGPVWSVERRRWVLPLNERGRRTCEAFLAKYRHRPEASICGTDGTIHGSKGKRQGKPGHEVYAKALRVLGEDEMRSVAHDAVVRASAKYDPAAHGCGEGGYTYIVHGVYLSLLRAVEVAESVPRRYGFQADELWEGEDHEDLLPGFEDDPSASSEMEDLRRLLERASERLRPEERRAIISHYRDGVPQTHIGLRLGVSRTRGGQIVRAAVLKLGAALGELGVNRNTIRDGSTMPPPRRQRCLNKSPSAASL